MDEQKPGLPSEEVLRAQFNYLVNYWQNRNKFILDQRNMVNGLNPIQAPHSTQYVVKTLHSYIVASLMNEKMSRFTLRPIIQVIPDEEIDPEGREKSTRIENAINIANYEMEQRSDADVWSRQIFDAVLVDEGVSKILRAPSAFWPEIEAYDEAVERGEEPEESYAVGSKLRDAYKKRQGVPLTRVYVPLENFYPDYDGPILRCAFEVSERSYSAIINDPLFKIEGQEALNEMGDEGADGGLSKTFNVVEYVNSRWHGYYLCGPGANSGNSRWPRLRPTASSFTGRLRHLYSYEHKLGRNLYNPMGGRNGGWKTNDNRIEGVGKGLLELSQAADDILSQVLTNVRAKYWPMLNFQMDPEQRGYPTGVEQQPPKIQEGDAIVTYKGESITPIFKPEEDPMAIWLFSKIEGQVGRLGGSAVLFGEHLPGVDTGYQQALQQTSAESVDEKIEQNVSKAAQQDTTLIMLHCKALGERVWMHYTETLKDTGRKLGKYVYLDPEDLVPLPRVDAQVRKPSPIDYLTSLRAAREASDDRNGKGPLLSDDTIHEKIMGTTNWDVEHKKIIVESQQREIINSGVLSAQIGQRINIKLAKLGIPDISPEMLAKADPQLLSMLSSGANGQAAAAGGIDPSLMARNGLPPGPAAGNPEPMNRLGEAVVGNMQTGASI